MTTVTTQTTDNKDKNVLHQFRKKQSNSILIQLNQIILKSLFKNKFKIDEVKLLWPGGSRGLMVRESDL